MRGERIEEVKGFQYLGTILNSTERWRSRERAVKGGSIIVSVARVMRGRNVSMKVKRGLRNSILLLI